MTDTEEYNKEVGDFMVTIRKPKNALKFTLPAGWWGSSWREAVPTGNGVIGAAVYGGAANDVIMISHSDNWLPTSSLRCARRWTTATYATPRTC